MSLYSRLVCAMALLTAVATTALGGPISSCAPNEAGLFTCNLYETNADGNFTENPSPVLIGNTVGLGSVVFLEPGIDPSVVANQININNWSDVIKFTLSSDHYFVQLFSDPFSLDFFRSTLDSSPSFLAESVQDPTVFIGGSGNTYNIFSQSAADTEAPEPGSAGLLFAGAAVLAGLAWFRRLTV